MFLFLVNPSEGQTLKVEMAKLPALKVNGEPARAHTQGLEVAGGRYYITARQEDVRPKRALLLRTGAESTTWDVWDITPTDPTSATMNLDHPGGLQSDNARLWIPIAESKPNSHCIIRVFPLAGLVAGQPLKSEFEILVNDHIGAVAVDASHRLVLGANWDTETVYVWNFEGRLERKLTSSTLTQRGLGSVNRTRSPSGVAVQDWKFIGDRLFASGLCRETGSAAPVTRSRLISFANFLQPESQSWTVALPLQEGTELAREAMAVAEGMVYFLPEDLGATNRLFRIPLAELSKGAASP